VRPTTNRKSAPNRNDHVWVVILAGGSGTRFWPKSRHRTPKQLIALGQTEQTMLEVTLARLDGIVAPARRIIVTHADQANATRKIARRHVAAVLAEPSARNTAAALALAALEIRNRAKSANTEPILVSVHADAVIKDVPIFRKTIAHAIGIARSGRMTLVGVSPTSPETGYGYIERGDPIDSATNSVRSFREKPPLETAREYLRSGNYVWNSGMFVLPLGKFIRALETHLPDTMQKLTTWQARKGFRSFATPQPPAFARLYASLEKQAIDTAVFERTTDLAVVAADFGWQDVGSWDGLSQAFGTDLKSGNNYRRGDTLLIETRNCVVDTDGPIITAVGVEDLVIVHARGAILVCPKSRSQDVRKIVEALREQGRKELL